MTGALILFGTMWAVNGLYFVVKSGSRGAYADIMFGLFWPFYWYADWRNGLWDYSHLDTVRLLLPSLMVLAIAVLARAAS